MIMIMMILILSLFRPLIPLITGWIGNSWCSFDSILI